MSITLATGTQAAIASAYGTASNVSAVSNAANAVMTVAAAHGLIVGDFVEFTSGWDLATGRIFRVSAVATNDVTLEGLNTTSVSNYPAGAGVGSVRKISTWTPITQLQSIGTGGGDQNFADITTIADRTQKQIPTTRSPQEINLTVFDDPALGWYVPVVNASDSASPAGLRFIFPNGSRLVANGYWSIQKTPTVAANQPLTADITFSALAEPVRYAT
jgi:Phage tail tube protein, TTP